MIVDRCNSIYQRLVIFSFIIEDKFKSLCFCSYPIILHFSFVMAGLQMSKQYLKKQSSTLNSKRKAFLDVLKRSSRTLMHLDCLLLDWCDVKSSQFATEDSDVPFLHNDTCSIPAPELRNGSCTAIEDSQYFCNRDRFGTVVSHLFGNFNTRQTSLDGNYVLHTGVESHGITDTSQEE